MILKQNLAVWASKFRFTRLVSLHMINYTAIVVLMMAVSACASTTSAPVPQPTGALILFTPTPTEVPITPTPTLPPPPAASDLILTPRVVDTGFENDAPILSATLLDLAVETGIEVRQIVPVGAESVHWDGENLDCDNELLRLTTQGIAGYQVIYLIDTDIYVYHTSDEEFLLCDEYDILDAPAEVLIQIDPVAADLVALARRRIAQELDLSTRLIDILDVSVETWADTSLGCPADDQSYENVSTNGYRILLLAGGNEYLFHTSFDRLIRCEQPAEATTEPSN